MSRRSPRCLPAPAVTGRVASARASCGVFGFVDPTIFLFITFLHVKAMHEYVAIAMPSSRSEQSLGKLDKSLQTAASQNMIAIELSHPFQAGGFSCVVCFF